MNSASSSSASAAPPRGGRTVTAAPGRPDAVPRRPAGAPFGATAPACGALFGVRTATPAWQEFRNKWECFDLFEEARLAVLRRGAPGVPLTESVARVATLGAYRALWATEALGHAYTVCAAVVGRNPRGLFSDGDASLPPGSLVPLHSGMGLAFAGCMLDPLPLRPRVEEIDRVVDRFVRSCLDNARAGWAEAALEALGLVTRTLHPWLVPLVDRCLAARDERLPALFWHGVGRGLYFAPTNFLPSAWWFWQGLDKARREPRHDLGRLNAIAGLAWALTLVNVRHPVVLERFLCRHDVNTDEAAAFADGVATAAIVWRHWAPATPYVEALARHTPNHGDERLAARWQALVRGPCLTVLADESAAHGGATTLGELFRYCPPGSRGGASRDPWRQPS